MTVFVQSLTRLPITLAMGGIALIVALMPLAPELLQFDRPAIASGAFWRLATCHVTHWNLEHFWWDGLMFVVLAATCELRDRRRMMGSISAAAVAVTALVWFGCLDIATYRGLSGIDTALFTMLAMEVACEARRKRNHEVYLAASGLLLGFTAKTAYEAFTGQTYFVDQNAAGFVPLVWDHLVAGVVGACFAWNAPLSVSAPQRSELGKPGAALGGSAM
jgi:rhomboid family GlyGly-CTERM serine protease